jgi:AcrR family transcriptional regulator
MPATDRKSTQRERILDGMIDAASRYGYAGANISQVIAHAGVSRPTFYEYFTDKDSCFLAANREIAERLLAQIRDAVAEVPPEQALQAALRRLLQRVEAKPDQAMFLANATMAGGPRALDERDRTIVEIERIVEAARAKTPPQTLSPDLPPRVIIGATHWLLSPRLRRGELDLTPLADEFVTLIETYKTPHGTHRWHTLEPGPQPPVFPLATELSLRPPPPLAPGRSNLKTAEVARNQRYRIMYATAEVAERKGYTASTIDDITTAARVDRRVFYGHFRDKQDAFLTVHEFAIPQLLALGAQAFFSASTWPERVWRGLLASSQFLALHPTLSHIGYVESHAVGSPAIQRIEDSHQAFKIFFREGHQHAEHPPSETATEAIIASVFEIGYQQTRGGHTKRLPSFAYQAAYMALTPYLGPRVANEFIDEKLEANLTLSVASDG